MRGTPQALLLYAAVMLVLLMSLQLAMQMASHIGWMAVDQYARPARWHVFPRA